MLDKAFGFCVLGNQFILHEDFFLEEVNLVLE